LIELLPEAPISTRSFETFTSFNEATRELVTVGADYPRTASATFWTSKLANDLSSATASAVNNVEIAYPAATSPFPLNVLHLKLTRIFHSADGTLFGVYENGEIHIIDLVNKQSKMVVRMTSDDRLLGVEYPTATWAHAYDPDTNTLSSVFMGGVNAYYVQTNLATMKVSDWVQMAMPQGANSGFSPETFVNAHIMKPYPGASSEFVVLLESFAELGFDQINYVNVTSGQMIPWEFNLMEYNIEFSCGNVMECDKKRNSAWDPVGQMLYFQAHDATDKTSLLNRMGWTTSVLDSSYYPYVNPALDPFTFGNGGFIFIQKV
jgi:hypothetical protein